MLCVLAALLYLYLSAGIHMLSHLAPVPSRPRGGGDAGTGTHGLLGEHETLARQETLEAEARQLGMMKKGEQPYVITGLPAD